MNKVVNGKQCTVVIYVDDLFFTCELEYVIDDTLAVLCKAFESKLVVNSGLEHDYLGMHFNFASVGEVKVTMPGYIEELMKLSSVTGIADSPASPQLFTINKSPTLLTADEKEWFHSQVARILYLAKRVRGELLLIVSFLATRVNHPDQDDRKKLIRMLRYINGTRHDPGSPIAAYIDASYVVHSDYRSHTGMIITVGGGAIDMRSTKQKLNVKSSTEAELVALSDMCSRVIWCREFLVAQGMKPPPANVFQDNQSTIALVKRGNSASERTRHVAIRFFWVKDRVDNGDLEIVYMPTKDMIADVLTKPLQGEAFKRLRNMLLNWNF
jgi:hypothetical protein